MFIEEASIEYLTPWSSQQLHKIRCHYFLWHSLGDVVALLVGHRTCDLQVAGSSPGWAPLRNGYSHLCASVTKQYNLLPAKRQWCSLAGKVTTGLVESSARFMTKSPCRLTAKRLGSVPSATPANRVWDCCTFKDYAIFHYYCQDKMSYLADRGILWLFICTLELSFLTYLPIQHVLSVR